MSMLKPASNKHAFAKIGLYGDAGSGKTYTAAKIAIGLHQAAKLDKPVGMFDTEPAASYIMPLFQEAGIEFLVYDESRALKDLMAFMDEAEQACSIVIVDSITHVWRDAQDSFLKRINDQRRRKNLNPIYQLEFHHWKPIKANWQAFTDRYLSSKVHCIVCGRAGSIYEYQKNDQGKMELITTGTKMATEKELGYEPSLLVEMIKHREDGKIINRALVEKDRTDKINGAEIDFPDYEKLKPHFDFLNIGGQHFDSMNQRNSVDLYDDEGNDQWRRERKEREIWCEEIQALLLEHYPSTSAADKKAKSAALKKTFNTGSWTKVQDMDSTELEAGFVEMKAMLGKPLENEAA